MCRSIWGCDCQIIHSNCSLDADFSTKNFSCIKRNLWSESDSDWSLLKTEIQPLNYLKLIVLWTWTCWKLSNVFQMQCSKLNAKAETACYFQSISPSHHSYFQFVIICYFHFQSLLFCISNLLLIPIIILYFQSKNNRTNSVVFNLLYL